MATLARIAASYGVQPIELAVAVGLTDTDPHAELGPERTAVVVNTADDSEILGAPGRGRHRLRWSPDADVPPVGRL